MKAKVKTTGEVIEVSQTENIITKRGVERQYVDNKRSWCTYVQSELEFIKEEPHKNIDWEQRRYEIAKDMMTAKDGKSVIFKKLKKVGEPEIINGKKVQSIVTGYVGCAFCIFKKGGACLSGGTCKNRGTRIYVEIKQNKEDMEEKKLNLKEFDLEAAKAGKPVCTRDGRKARIICFDAKCNKPIVALIYDCNKETVLQYLESGRFFVDQIDKYDLMMLLEKKEGWVNVYNSLGVITFSHNPYDTKEEAMKDKGKYYVDTVKIEWEE